MKSGKLNNLNLTMPKNTSNILPSNHRDLSVLRPAGT